MHLRNFDPRKAMLVGVWISLVAAAALSLLFISSCDSTDRHWVVVHLSGVVRDSAQGTPLESAWVALDDSVRGAKIVTKSDGLFDLVRTETAVAIIYAGKAGFGTTSKELRDVHKDIDSILLNLTPSSRR